MRIHQYSLLTCEVRLNMKRFPYLMLSIILLNHYWMKRVMDLLRRADLRFILYGNGDLTSEKAWVLLRRKNLQNASILKGGLNDFTKTIFAAEKPGEGADTRAHELYSLRQAIALYLGGGSIELEPDEVTVQKTYSSGGTKTTDSASKTGTSVTPKKVTPKKVVPKKVKKKVEEEEEGC